jgi:GNAT superfamily N-acetyltransferase
MDTVTIRDREPDDLRRCAELLGEVHRCDGYPLNWPSDPLRWLCASDVLHAWIAEAGGAVVGHVSLHRGAAAPAAHQNAAPAAPAAPAAHQNSAPAARQHPAAGTVEVGRLFVAPAFRRRHVATGLLQQARRWAADHHAGLTLEVVDDGRSAAIALYEGSGWQHADTTAANWTAPDGSAVTLRRYTIIT